MFVNSYDYGTKKYTCPECSHTRKNKRDLCLTVTRDSEGILWHCHHCGYEGGMNDKVQFIPKKPKLKTISIVHNKSKNQTPMMEFFRKRNINQETVNHFKITYEDWGNGYKNEGVVFPYYVDNKLVNKKFRTLDKKFRQLPDSPRTLFNIDSLLNEHKDLPLVIVEGEMDVLSMHQVGYTKCISLPDGAPKEAKYKENDKRFEALNTHAELLAEETNIIIATDNDDAGNALALELAHRFGKDRCSRVHWCNITGDVDIKDANDALVYGASDTIDYFIKKAVPYPIDGLYKAKDYINQVMDLYTGAEEKPLTTGYKLLDLTYKLMQGTFTVVTGIPNHGKSNFLDQILMNASKLHNWKFAIYSPEHSTPRHLTRLAEKYLELPFHEGATRKMSQQELLTSMGFINKHFYFIESREQRPTIDWILDKARISVIKHGINGIVIDPYNEIDTDKRGRKREDEYIKDIIASCKRFARTHNVCVWIVAHPAKMHRQNDGSYPIPSMYDISGSAHWHNMADIGLCVHRDFDSNETVVYTKKVREQGLYGEIGQTSFTFNTSTKVYKEVEIDVTPVSDMVSGNTKWYDKD